MCEINIFLPLQLMSKYVTIMWFKSQFDMLYCKCKVQAVSRAGKFFFIFFEGSFHYKNFIAMNLSYYVIVKFCFQALMHC